MTVAVALLFIKKLKNYKIVLEIPTYSNLSIRNRWRFTKEELSKHDIQVIGFGTDCDLRCLRNMKDIICLGQKLNDAEYPGWSKFFCCTMNPEFINFQDTLHIFTKLRQRLIKKKVMHVGDSEINVQDLKVSNNNGFFRFISLDWDPRYTKN